MEKPIEEWTKEDWLAESVRLTGDEDVNGDAVICGAMLLASLREGPRITKIAKAIGSTPRRLRWMFDNLVKNRVFTRSKVDGREWFDDESGGVAFNIAVCCGLGFIERARNGA